MCGRPRRTCGMCCRCGDMCSVLLVYGRCQMYSREYALCAALYIGGRGGWALLLEVPEVPEVMRCALSVCWGLWRGGSVFRRCWRCRGVPEATRCVQLCMLEVLEVPGVPEATRCVQLCMLEAVEGGLRFLDVLKVPEVTRRVQLSMLDMFEVLKVIRCWFSVCWRLWRLGSVFWRCWRCRR